MASHYDGKATLTINGIDIAGTLSLDVMEEPVMVNTRAFKRPPRKVVVRTERLGEGHFVADNSSDVPALDYLLDANVCSLRFHDGVKERTVPVFVSPTEVTGTLQVTLAAHHSR